MTAKKFAIYIEQGTDWQQDFPMLDNDGNPIDMLDCHASMQIKTMRGVSTALITLTSQNGGLILTSGNIRAVIGAISSNAIPGGEDVYDIKFVNAENITSRPYEGLAVIDGAVTSISASILAGQLDFSKPSNCFYLFGVM